MPVPQYPLHGERQQVRRDGSPRFQIRQPRLSETLAGEAPGLVGVEEEPSQLWFCPHGVAVLDAVLGERWDITSAGCRLATIRAALEGAEA